MAILEILEFPDPRLRKVATPVTQFDDELKTLVNNMIETMYDAEGIGLAATQVNVHQQVIVIDISETRDEPLVFINPSFNVAACPYRVITKISNAQKSLKLPRTIQKETRLPFNPRGS